MASIKPRHLVVLIHGLMGTERDLAYLAQRVGSLGGPSVLCHAVAANARGMYGSTVDGVASGGERACDEVQLVLKQNPSVRRLSVVGNSLGGLYGRYMVSALAKRLDGQRELEAEAFVTVATPHLGIANLTYWPVPSVVESGIATLLQRTGGDLFRRDTLLADLALEAEYLEPLARFKRRRAYGSVRGDFLVIPESALFLPDPDVLVEWRLVAALDSEQPPPAPAGRPAAADGALGKAMSTVARIRRELGGDREDDAEGRIVSIVDSRGAQRPDPETLARARVLSGRKAGAFGGLPGQDGMILPTIPSRALGSDSGLQAMASSLDGLGWSKVIVDFPKARLPLNHNRICALSRNEIAKLVWQDGRRIMDDAAAYILGTDAAETAGG